MNAIQAIISLTVMIECYIAVDLWDKVTLREYTKKFLIRMIMLMSPTVVSQEFRPDANIDLVLFCTSFTVYCNNFIQKFTDDKIEYKRADNDLDPIE